MTLEQFQKKVIRTNWYDKYFYYLLFLAATVGGLFFLYDVIVHQVKYDKLGTKYLGYLSFLFLTTLGVSGLYFVPNRYKIITIASTLPTDKKQKIIAEVLKEFGNPYCDTGNDFYGFTFDKNWWTSDYKIYLTFDPSNFYASVQGVTRAYRGGGIIDLGGAERVRKKVISILTRPLVGQ
jgi:hypothetical protein